MNLKKISTLYLILSNLIDELSYIYLERFKILVQQMNNSVNMHEEARVGAHITLASKLCDNLSDIPPNVLLASFLQFSGDKRRRLIEVFNLFFTLVPVYHPLIYKDYSHLFCEPALQKVITE